MSGKRAIRLSPLDHLCTERKNYADTFKTSCIEPQYKDLELVVQYCHARLAYETKLFFFTEAGGVFLRLDCLFFALGGGLVFTHGCVDGSDFYLH